MNVITKGFSGTIKEGREEGVFISLSVTWRVLALRRAAAGQVKEGRKEGRWRETGEKGRGEEGADESVSRRKEGEEERRRKNG